jgi:crossover junction endodeoxyribonuclease RusA
MGAVMIFELPFPPSVNSMYRNVAKRGRAKTAEYSAWIKEAGTALSRQMPKQEISGQVCLRIDLDKRRKGDCTNRAKAVEDLLVSHGILSDDSQKWVRRVDIGWEDVRGCVVTVQLGDRSDLPLGGSSNN